MPHYPRRVQIRRDQPWRRHHPHAVIVDRRSRWGNPFVPVKKSGTWMVLDENGVDYPVVIDTKAAAAHKAVELFRTHILLWNEIDPDEIRRDLANHDLACWCPPTSECHADVLIDIANTHPRHRADLLIA